MTSFQTVYLAQTPKIYLHQEHFDDNSEVPAEINSQDFDEEGLEILAVVWNVD